MQASFAKSMLAAHGALCKHEGKDGACMADEPKDEEEPSGKAKGGVARAEALSPERRRSIARRAAAARWGLKATHKGSFKEDFGFDVECYVLDDEQKTAAIGQRGMGVALGLGEGGTRLTRFMSGLKIAPFVGPELAEKLAKPLIFQWSAVGQNTPPNFVHGYDVTVLIDVCKVIIAADEAGPLLKSQQNALRQARIVMNASAKLGIKTLVYSLAGYDATREEIVAAFKDYVRSEAREYEREFPNALYDEWYRLYGLPRPEKNKPWKFQHLTVDQVYKPLARSNGKILELTRALRAKSEARRNKLHQYLSEIGVKVLRTHLGQLLGMAQVSDTKEDYERHVNKVFGRQLTIESIFPSGRQRPS
jgi:hypothetical protein